MGTDLQERLQASLGGAYTFERELGGGGMSRVFLAEERRLGRRVVVKVLSPELAADISAERFEREIRMAARLQDPRIVPVLSAGEAGGMAYYTMPFVQGESLRALLQRGAVPRALAIPVLRDVALALDHAHRHGVVHRDIKPENILLSGSTAMVTDFGIGKAITAATEGAAHETLTQLGMIVGTPAYMSPEQASGGVVDHRSDLYALGVIAYELLAGAHPFAGRKSTQAMVAAHIAEKPAPLAIRAPDLPPGVVRLVERLLAKEPADRPVDAAEVVRALDALEGGGGSTRWTPRSRHTARLAAVAALGLAATAAAIALRTRTNAAGSERAAVAPSTVRSIAVLPFVDPSGDTTGAYFADGMADELTTALANGTGLRVAARSAAFRFRGEGVSARAVGEALDVQAMLHGTVRRSGERLRVTAQLVSAADESVLWGATYDRRMQDVFDVQDEISRTIVSELRSALGGRSAGASAAAPRGTTDLGAYDLYLRGRFSWAKRGEQGLRSAIRYFGDAVRQDPSFARAHAGLAMSYVVLPLFDAAFPTDSAIVLAQESANRALALDSTLADAHLALAYTLKMRWRFDEAERYFRNALALAPDDAAARHWYGVHLYVVGRLEEAIAQFEKARALDPYGTTIATDGAIALYGARRFSEAHAELRRGLALDTTKSDSWVVLGLIELALGRPDSAVRSLGAARRFGTGLDVRPYLSVAYRRLDRPRDARAMYDELRRDYARGRAIGYDVAIAAAAAGDHDVALDAVTRIVEERHMFVTELTLPCDPLFDPLKRDPRFERLLRGAGMRMCPAARPG